MRSFRMLSKNYSWDAYVVLPRLWGVSLSVKYIHKEQPVARGVAIMESVFAMWSAAYGAAWVVVSADVAGDIFAVAMVAEYRGCAASSVGGIGSLQAGAALGIGIICGSVRWDGRSF